MPRFSSLLALSLALAAAAHPGHNVAEEALERREFLSLKPRTVQSCANSLQRRDYHSAAVARRAALAGSLRSRRGLVPRDFSDYNTSHASTLDVSFGDDELALFADNSSCILQPEVTQGPYYVSGELIRHDLTETQTGVPLYVDIQVLDTSTCEPVPAVYLDFWHCNATGVYSGVSASGNGNSNDTSNLDATFLRGIQQTDFNGVVQFETVFPGHYTGNTTVRTNDTLLSGNMTTHASHVGQLFFDQDLISQVQATEPYASNTQDLTLNADDMILGQEAESMDPFVEYILIGDKIEDGVLAWITIGIDSTADSEISAAATIYATGGVANEDGGMGGPGGSGGPGGNSTDGAMPSAPPS